MHKILVQTELVRLRTLGYEVFNPPYLSTVEDQSAELHWDANQYSTLPKEVFDKLSKYNFFYNLINKEISEILNTYFDTVIVTISTNWLGEILKCYNGKIIYRVYGQSFSISQELERNKFLHHIVSRDNFWFVPHAKEAVISEHSWLREREEVVPYCLPKDIFEYTDRWKLEGKKKPIIAITCPNIKNAYFRQHYLFLKKNFGTSKYRYYGVQMSAIKDYRVVGTLPRKELISSFLQCSGYLYTHTEERVCYLPPIEMMVLGGPVLYLKGSLLDRYFPIGSPGRCSSIDEAQKKSELLIKQDVSFINDVIASQKEVRERYSQEFVWPIFDSVFNKILNENNKAPAWLEVGKEELPTSRKRIYVFHHFPGSPVIAREGTYFAYDGIPRVVRQIVNVLSSQKNIEVVITARSDQVANMNGFFRSHEYKDRVKIFCIDPSNVTDVLATDISKRVKSLIRRLTYFSHRALKQAAKQIIPVRFHNPIRNMLRIIPEYLFSKREVLQKLFPSKPLSIQMINHDDRCLYAFVPHYYLFPEALKLNKKIVMYLPDYMPYFFHETGEFAMNEGKDTVVGRLLVKKSEKVFCNSYFTKEYLPDCLLKVPAKKICVSYLPCLNVAFNEKKGAKITLDERIQGRPYMFYPTQPRANKNLSFLLRVFNRLVTEGVDINLVLTSSLEWDPKAYAVYKELTHKNRIIFLNSVSDETLFCLYKNAAALCLTSLAEGNFPPQIHEALRYGTPIVASRLGFITERIPDHLKNSLILCEANHLDEFIEGCKKAIYSREEVLNKQRDFFEFLESENIESSFKDSVLEFFNLGVSKEV